MSYEFKKAGIRVNSIAYVSFSKREALPSEPLGSYSMPKTQRREKHYSDYKLLLFVSC